jgi:PST family polysaccharide transporter
MSTPGSTPSKRQQGDGPEVVGAEAGSGARRAGGLAALGMGVRIVSQLMSLALLLVAGRVLSVEAFGLFALAVILINLAQQLLYSGVYAFILRQPDLAPYRGTALTLQGAIALTFSLLITGVAALIWLIAPQSALGTLMLATAPLPLIGVMGCWQEANVLRAGKVAPYYASLLVSEVSGFALGLFLLQSEAGVWSLIFSRYATGVLFAVGLSLFAPKLPRPEMRAGPLREMLGFSLGLYGSSGLNFFTAYAADVLIGAVLNTRAVGLYRMGARTATAAYDIFAQTTRVLSWQVVGRNSRQGRVRNPVWLPMYALILCVIATALGTMAVLAEPLTAAILGPDWAEMVPVLQLIAGVRIVSALDLVATAHFTAAGQSRLLLRLRLLEAGLLLASVAALVWTGPLGVALALWPPALIVGAVFLHLLTADTGVGGRQVLGELGPALAIAAGAILAALAVKHFVTAPSALLMVVQGSLAALGAFLVMALGVFRGWTMRTVRRLSQALQHESEGIPVPPEA